MEKILIKEPEMFPDAPKTALTKWKEQGPISISEMVAKSGIDIKDLDSDNIEIKRVDYDNFYDYGMFKKGTEETHGIARMVYDDGEIHECMF